jgi:hypothetical protein
MSMALVPYPVCHPNRGYKEPIPQELGFYWNNNIGFLGFSWKGVIYGLGFYDSREAAETDAIQAEQDLQAGRHPLWPDAEWTK